MFIPNKVELHSSEELIKISPFIKNLVDGSSESKVYVCEGYKCNLPTDDAKALTELLT
jgi:uncharacterized protein YyaL (SSP411 family)